MLRPAEPFTAPEDAPFANVLASDSVIGRDAFDVV